MRGCDVGGQNDIQKLVIEKSHILSSLALLCYYVLVQC